MEDQRFICCLKYGDAYSVDYVNVLYSAVHKAMRSSFRFICFTDCSVGLVPGIEPYPIPCIGLDADDWRVGGVWPKLGIYDSCLFGLRGRALFIDLDMVILRDLDSFFEVQGDFIGIDGGASWGRPNVKAFPELGSAVVAFDLGSLGFLADDFRVNKVEIMHSYPTEQAYTASRLEDVRFWPAEWVISFKRSLRQPLLLDLFLEAKSPPSTAKIIAFHGIPRPSDLISGSRQFWDHFPHMGNGKVSWMVDYWYDNGGNIF